MVAFSLRRTECGRYARIRPLPAVGIAGRHARLVGIEAGLAVQRRTAEQVKSEIAEPDAALDKIQHLGVAPREEPPVDPLAVEQNASMHQKRGFLVLDPNAHARDLERLG